jgi:hypothetical protein
MSATFFIRRREAAAKAKKEAEAKANVEEPKKVAKKTAKK